MVEDILRWPTIGGTYLEVLDCLGTALVDLLGGVMDFTAVDALEWFWDWVDFGARGLERCRGAERTNWFKQIFSSDVDV